MKVDDGVIFSQCVFDADNRYVDLTLRPTADNSDAFMLTMTDTADVWDDTEIELYLTRDDLIAVICRLTKVLENE